MKMKKHATPLQLSASLILVASLGLVGCQPKQTHDSSPNEELETTPPVVEVAPNEESTDSNTEENTENSQPTEDSAETTPPIVEVAPNQESTDSNTEDSIKDSQLNDDSIKTESPNHPFGEIEEVEHTGPFIFDFPIEFGGDDISIWRHGRIDFNTTNFTKEEFVTFYESEVKGSFYNIVEVRLNDDIQILFHSDGGAFAVVDLTDETPYTSVNGFIKSDGEVLYYSDRTIETKDLEQFSQQLMQKNPKYQVLSSVIESGTATLVLDGRFIQSYNFASDQLNSIYSVVSNISTEFLKLPNAAAIRNLQVKLVYGDSPSDSIIAEANISFEELVTRDWNTFDWDADQSVDFLSIDNEYISALRDEDFN